MNAKTFNCDCCERKFFAKRSLSDQEISAHQRIIPQDHLCVECGKTFVSVKRLDEHKETMHKTDVMMHTCKNCKKSFKNERLYKAHTSRNHLALPCSMCDKKFGSRSALNADNKMKHANPIWTWFQVFGPLVFTSSCFWHLLLSFMKLTVDARFDKLQCK